jgi:hypothetical protein
MEYPREETRRVYIVFVEKSEGDSFGDLDIDGRTVINVIYS